MGRRGEGSGGSPNSILTTFHQSLPTAITHMFSIQPDHSNAAAGHGGSSRNLAPTCTTFPKVPSPSVFTISYLTCELGTETTSPEA